MSKDKNDAELATPEPDVRDQRPRYADLHVPELGGDIRIRRMEPQQVYTQLIRFQEVGIDPTKIACTLANKPELCRLIQRCLVPKQGPGLLCPGGKGVRRLFSLPDGRIEKLAQQVAVFLEL